MPFSLKDLNPATTFYFDDEKEEWIELRLVPDAKYNEFRKELGIKQKRVREYTKKGDPVFIDTVDNDEDKMFKLIDMANDYMIKGWHIVTEEEEEIECTPENKKLMLSESPIFSGWVDKCIKELKEDKENRNEEVVKN